MRIACLTGVDSFVMWFFWPKFKLSPCSHCSTYQNSQMPRAITCHPVSSLIVRLRSSSPQHFLNKRTESRLHNYADSSSVFPGDLDFILDSGKEIVFSTVRAFQVAFVSFLVFWSNASKRCSQSWRQLCDQLRCAAMFNWEIKYYITDSETKRTKKRIGWRQKEQDRTLQNPGFVRVLGTWKVLEFYCGIF